MLFLSQCKEWHPISHPKTSFRWTDCCRSLIKKVVIWIQLSDTTLNQGTAMLTEQQALAKTIGLNQGQEYLVNKVETGQY